MLVIAGLRKLRQESCCKFKPSLGYKNETIPQNEREEVLEWEKQRNPDCVGISEDQTRQMFPACLARGS